MCILSFSRTVVKKKKTMFLFADFLETDHIATTEHDSMNCKLESDAQLFCTWVKVNVTVEKATQVKLLLENVKRCTWSKHKSTFLLKLTSHTAKCCE